MPAFEALKMTSAWAGHYDQNSFDNNAILGPWVGGLENFQIALGFSGHGLMQAPAVGRGLSELLLHGSYQTLDLSRLGYQRILDGVPLHDEVPNIRMSVFRLLAAAVSVGGTASMISSGSAE